ncbi:MAG: lysoplasmalogenase [Chloroflexi bacterium]|nr:MAG: lysoplasmalogenase [Chloroflexota bacterium]TME14663.1 MAG: lysoplasmalogenase [Chloroflexota bacterium]
MAKPAFMVFLIIAVLFVHPFDGVVRWWFAAALLFGLLGDVALMLPRERWFLPGTIVFLVGHLAYIGGFLRIGARLPYAFAGAVVALVLVAAVGPSIIRALRSQKSPLLVPVVAYMLVFAVMLALAFGTTRKLIIAGALLFALSDALLGYYQFARPLSWGRNANIVLYQAGQAGLALSLAL